MKNSLFFKLFSYYSLLVFAVTLPLTSCSKARKEPEPKTVLEPAVKKQTEPEPQPASRTAPISLDYSEGELDVGQLFEYETRKVTVKMKNESDKDIVVASISPTCNCTAVSNFHTNETLAAGATMDIVFNVIAHKIPVGEFHRNVLIDFDDFESSKIFYRGEVLAAAIVRPSPKIDLGLLTSNTQPWEKEVEIAGAVNLPEELIIPEHLQYKYFNLDLTRNEKNNYTLKITPQAPLPYGRNFKETVRIAPARPLGIKPLEITITAHVGEKVTFSPQDMNFPPLLLQKKGSLTAGAAFGLVTGYKYEPPEPYYNSRREQLNAFRRRQKTSSITLEDVMTNVDWNVLMEQLEFQTPEHVTVEKIRHTAGIELKVTVTPEAFALSKNLKVVPHCGEDTFRPLLLTSYENAPRKSQRIEPPPLPMGILPPGADEER